MSINLAQLKKINLTKNKLHNSNKILIFKNPRNPKNPSNRNNPQNLKIQLENKSVRLKIMLIITNNHPIMQIKIKLGNKKTNKNKVY